MLTQRSEGLRRLLLICQIWITAGLFWLGVWVMVKFYSPSGELTWRRYSIYCVLLVLGLTLEYLGRDSSRDYPLQTDLLREHRVSLRQTVASIGTLVIYLIATKDGFISCVFLFNFVPCFYLALLFSHHYLPPFWPAGFLREFAGRKPCWLVHRHERRNCITGCDRNPRLACTPPDCLARKHSSKRAICRFSGRSEISIESC